MTDEPASSPPSSSAQALTVSGERSLRGLRTSLDELDEDDLVMIGRAFTSTTPPQLLSWFAVVLGSTAGVALASQSLLGAALVLLALPAFAVVIGRRDLRRALEEQGLAPALVDEIMGAATLSATTRSVLASRPWHRVIAQREDHARMGSALVAAARARNRR